MAIALSIIGIILLFLVYKKLDNLSRLFEKDTQDEVKKQKEIRDTDFQNWLYEDLKIIKTKIAELYDVHTVDNPAWGEDSAASKKRENLISLYAERIVQKGELSRKDALVKARFVVNNFESGIIDDILRDIIFHARVKSEEELLNSEFFKKEVKERADSLSPSDIFEPLWVGITHRKYKKGDELLQNTRKAFEAHSGDYGYGVYMKNSAIIYKLQDLGIIELKKKNDYSFQESQDRQTLGVTYDAPQAEIKSAYFKLAKKYHPDNADGSSEKFTRINQAYKSLTQKGDIVRTMNGHPWYILQEDSLQKLRDKVFSNDEQKKRYHDDAYFADKHSGDEDFDMPFHRPFEH